MLVQRLHGARGLIPGSASACTPPVVPPVVPPPLLSRCASEARPTTAAAFSSSPCNSLESRSAAVSAIQPNPELASLTWCTDVRSINHQQTPAHHSPRARSTPSVVKARQSEHCSRASEMLCGRQHVRFSKCELGGSSTATALLQAPAATSGQAGDSIEPQNSCAAVFEHAFEHARKRAPARSRMGTGCLPARAAAHRQAAPAERPSESDRMEDADGLQRRSSQQGECT